MRRRIDRIAQRFDAAASRYDELFAPSYDDRWGVEFDEASFDAVSDREGDGFRHLLTESR